MRAVILAAGRGSRLGDITEEHPKCLTPLRGRTILEREMASLRGGGVEEIVIVTGYRAEDLAGHGDRRLHNDAWDRSNMVVTLLRAREEFDRPVVVSYSDIIYSAQAVADLAACPADLAITYDRQWRALWEERFEDPLSDAESFSLDASGALADIGRRTTDYDEIQGQYMGLLKISPTGFEWILECLRDADPATIDTTTLLRKLLSAGRRIDGVPVDGNWMEIDSPEDLAVAEAMLTDGRLKH